MPAAGPSSLMPAVVGQRGPGPMSLLEAFAQVEDPRDQRGRIHPLPAVLSLVACAIAAGNTSPIAIGEWVEEAPQDLLERVGGYWEGLLQRFRAPDRKTVRRVLSRVDPSALDEATCAFVAEWYAAASPAPLATPGVRRLTALAVDGKWLRGSRTALFDPVMLMAVLAHEKAIVLGQIQVDGKSNEIPEVPRLLDLLMLTDCVVTFDALHTQRATARYLLSRGAHYVMTVKGNSPSLLAACHRLLARGDAVTGGHYEDERGHGVTRQRMLTVADADGSIDFPGAAQVACVRRWTRDLATNTVQTREIVYVITSLPRELADPAYLAELIRGHWRIENQLHYVRDVAFDEDKSTVTSGNLPRIMATFRNLAIGMLRIAGHSNITSQLRRHGRNPGLIPMLFHLA